MADNDFNSDGFPKDFSPRDFSETPRHHAEDAAKSAEGAGASEVNETKEFGSTDAKETKSFGHTEKPGKSGNSSALSSPKPSAEGTSSDFWASSNSSTPSEGAASRAHNPFTDSASSDAAANGNQFGSAQSANDQPVFGGYTQQQGTSQGFGQFPQAGDAPADSGQTLGDKKSQMSDTLKGLGKKDGLLGGLFEFEFKHFLTLTHVKEIYKVAMILGGIMWILHLLGAFFFATGMGIYGIREDSASAIFGSIFAFIFLAVLSTVIYYAIMVAIRLFLEAMVANVRIAQNTGDILDKMD
ncbi:DUF4282 domain-containing protein [Corynebacterium tuberculostearicum]|uniref:DUF4282 domain-containing protein n=1 Tax=Corynebacterium tuberculostearicum TaxID=38304 RepID=UPI002666336E|nr:DUF4282 domain-containing protein [Corynebacterium tuberculostearicum]WKE51449.1 DUF4282 domain-containing protein [Corynebacterium tuberculostearicum]